MADYYIHSLAKVDDPKKWTRTSFQRGTGQFHHNRPCSLDNFPKPDSPKPNSTPAEVKAALLPNVDPVKGPRCYHCHEYSHVAATRPYKTCLVSIVNHTLPFVHHSRFHQQESGQPISWWAQLVTSRRCIPDVWQGTITVKDK